jgi:hypothetical protein
LRQKRKDEWLPVNPGKIAILKKPFETMEKEVEAGSGALESVVKQKKSPNIARFPHKEFTMNFVGIDLHWCVRVGVGTASSKACINGVAQRRRSWPWPGQVSRI